MIEHYILLIGSLQAQALVVATLASIAAVVFGWVLDGHFDIHHAWLLGASSLVTASLASLILGVIMVGVILLSKKCKINPDNVATPIAASLGDLTTLALLSSISSFLYDKIGKLACPINLYLSILRYHQIVVATAQNLNLMVLEIGEALSLQNSQGQKLPKLNLTHMML